MDVDGVRFHFFYQSQHPLATRKSDEPRRREKPPCVLSKRDGRALGTVIFRVALLSMALYQVTYVLSIERTGVAMATLISICGAPVFVALISALFLGQRLGGHSVLALIAAVTGAALLVGFPADGLASEHYWEGIWIAIACA